LTGRGEGKNLPGGKTVITILATAQTSDVFLACPSAARAFEAHEIH
jgi:hypothetical protein